MRLLIFYFWLRKEDKTGLARAQRFMLRLLILPADFMGSVVFILGESLVCQ